MSVTTARTANLGTAAITGASSGIGRIYADRLARRGHDLLLIARRGDRLEAAAAEIRAAHGVEVTTLVADLGDAADLQRVAAALAADASLSMLVNNAGVATLAPVAAVTQPQAANMLDVNITALTALSMAVLPGFKSRDVGTIVNIGSVLGFATRPGAAIYGATKAYVMLFTLGLRDELVGTGVKVQLVAPAKTATEIWAGMGVSLDAMDASYMPVEACVDAALAGLDAGEVVTMPSVADAEPLKAFDQARETLLATGQTGSPAPRYGVTV